VPQRWTVEFFEDENGCPVREFLDTLDAPRRAKVLAIIQVLAEHGPTLPFPYSSQIDRKLRELRTHYGSEAYRVLYFGSPGRMFVLLHGFVKRTEKTRLEDIAVAERRMRAYVESRSPRRGPKS